MAVTRQDGRQGGRDWLQVGNKIHRLGKSHVDETGGYPKWGDDSSGNPPFARTVLWIASESAAKAGPVYQRESCSLTWDASKQIAARLGGRLLLLSEARAFLKGMKGPLTPGEDQWVAVIRKDGGKDWVQVGDKHHPVGKSHVDEGSGYPKWGDDASGNPPYARSLLWIPMGLVPVEASWVKPESMMWKQDKEICEAMWLKSGRSLTWADSKDFADERAGRLLSLMEARSFLAKHGPLFPDDDQWAAVVREDLQKDWIQVGNKIHLCGKSHVDDLGVYPSWGDDASKNPPHSRSVLWLATSIFS